MIQQTLLHLAFKIRKVDLSNHVNVLDYYEKNVDCANKYSLHCVFCNKLFKSLRTKKNTKIQPVEKEDEDILTKTEFSEMANELKKIDFNIYG